METYIEHIQKVAQTDPAYTTPIPMDRKALLGLFEAFNVELTYIKYKFVQNPDLDVKKEIAILMQLYLFNPVIRHAFNWAGIGMSVSCTEKACDKNDPPLKADVVIEDIPEMRGYAFYDGRPICKVISEQKAILS